ncbi:hypothetical protein [Rhodococcus sp. ABRD24]|uniref:hypothetical protein n=1 Tax=Rhodococcus sp. ABRD24 TaxID=2507582 RepID=UPI001F61D8F4|nr:hypothetical protein [Rhodococcus sp. ABRD24]
MTVPFATASVKASLDWGNLDAEFEARVRAAAVRATEAAEQHFKDIEFAANVRLDADTGLFSHETQARLNTLSLSANVTLEADKAALQASLATLSATVPVTLDVSPTQFQAFVAELNTKLTAADIVAPVRLDVANAAEFRAYIAHLTRPTTQIVRINTVGGGGDGVAGLGMSLDRVARNRVKIAGIASLIAAIGAAAGLAAGAVGALGVGLAGVGIAGAAGLAATVVGLQGVGDAFSALSDAASSAGADAAVGLGLVPCPVVLQAGAARRHPAGCRRGLSHRVALSCTYSVIASRMTSDDRRPCAFAISSTCSLTASGSRTCRRGDSVPGAAAGSRLGRPAWARASRARPASAAAAPRRAVVEFSGRTMSSSAHRAAAS